MTQSHSLVEFVLDSNDITTTPLSELLVKSQSKFPRLQTIGLSRNRVSHLMPNAKLAAQSLRLRGLDLSKNPILQCSAAEVGVDSLLRFLKANNELGFIGTLPLCFHRGESAWVQVKHFLNINMHGRALLSPSASVLISIWPQILGKVNDNLIEQPSRRANTIYYLLRNGPALATRGRFPRTKKRKVDQSELEHNVRN